MTNELKPCPKCLSGRVTCWNVAGGNQILCKDCKHTSGAFVKISKAIEDWNTRAVPDVPELVRLSPVIEEVGKGAEVATMVVEPDGEYVRHDQAIAVIADNPYYLIAHDLRIRAEAAEAKLAQIEKQKAVGEVVSAHGDPEAFGEREFRLLVDIQKMPYGTKFYTAPVAIDADLRAQKIGETMDAAVCNLEPMNQLEREIRFVQNYAVQPDQKITPIGRTEIDQKALEKAKEAFDAMFNHCFSNGVFNAWGKAMKCLIIIDAIQLVDEALKEESKT